MFSFSSKLTPFYLTNLELVYFFSSCIIKREGILYCPCIDIYGLGVKLNKIN